MTEIYIVTSGHYSDYGIEAIFDDLTLANAFVNSYRDSRYSCDLKVECWPLNKMKSRLERGETRFFIEMEHDGSTYEIYPSIPDYDIPHKLDLRTAFDRKPSYREWTILAGWIWAKSKEHAIKIANERRAELIATNQWTARIITSPDDPESKIK